MADTRKLTHCTVYLLFPCTATVPEVDLVSLCNLDALTTAQEETSTYILKGENIKKAISCAGL